MPRILNGFDDADTPVKSRRGQALGVARSRLVFIGILYCLGLLLVTARVSYLTVWQHKPVQAAKTKTQDAASLADALALGRADIVDTNGVLLATMVPSYSLYADPKPIQNKTELAKKLAPILGDSTSAEILKRLNDKGRFVWLKRGLSPAQIAAVNNIGEPALNFRTEPRRFYPQTNLTAHVVGYLSVDNDPLAGIERAQDKILDESGAPLKLTLDTSVQYAVHAALKKAVDANHAKAGAGLVMDVNTGAIIAAVSLPDFDANHAGDANQDQKRSRFVQDVYEMGSTFKVITVAALLDSGADSFNQYFNATNPIQRGGYPIGDFHAKKRILSLPEVLAYSSNIGTSLIGEKLGDKFVAFLERLKIGEKMTLDVSETSQPIMQKRWGPAELATATFGHGIATSLLHLARATASLVNGGIFVQPHFLQDAPVGSERIVSEQTSKKLRELMRLVVTHGSGKGANIDGYMVGGKTGTAQKPAPHGGYSDDKRISSFVGVFPMDKPKYLVAIMLDEPREIKDEATGGRIAAPVVKTIMQDLIDLYAIPPADAAVDAEFAAAVAPYMQQVKP